MKESRIAVLFFALVAVALLIRVWTLDVAVLSPELRTNQSADVAALQAQLDQTQQYQEQLLQTVYFTLGALVTVGLVLVGFSWYQNRLSYERDRTALESLISSSLSKSLQEAESKLEELGSQRHEEVRSLVQSHQDQAANLLKNLESRLADRIERVRSGANDSLKESMRTRDRELRWIQASLYELEANAASTRGLSNSAVMKRIQLVKLYIDHIDQFSGTLSYALARLAEEVSNCDFLASGDEYAINVVLNRLSSDYSVQIEQVRDAMRTRKVNP